MALDPNSFPRADIDAPGSIVVVEQKITGLLSFFQLVGTGSDKSPGATGLEG